MQNNGTAEQFLSTALSALRNGEDLRAVLDELTVPIYTTDASGSVTYWNQACADLVGREPRAGEDQWCVTWRLYTLSGEPVEREDCPMARAIREKRELHDEILVAERPDGRRVACRVYPTPFFNDEGEVEGAVNLFIDVTSQQACELAEQAARCRRLARATTDAKASTILGDMAQGYACTAATLRAND